MVEPEDRFKLVDDLTMLEIINLLCMQITSYDIYSHVPSDIPVHNGYIDKKKLKSQENLSLINLWTKKKKIILNMKTTKNMIFNYAKKHRFTISRHGKCHFLYTIQILGKKCVIFGNKNQRQSRGC